MTGVAPKVRPQMMQAGSNSALSAYRASPESLPGPSSEGEGSVSTILSELGGVGGRVIRHAPAAAFPVGPLPVAVIEPSLRALLVPPVGGTQSVAATRFLPASLAAVPVAPVAMTTNPEHRATAGPPANPLTQ